MKQGFPKTSAFPAGFTLIELLLVIVILGISLVIAMPSLVRSIQGQKLRTAGRTMVTVARYARSMAILKQTDLTLNVNMETGQIDLLSTNVTLPRFSRIIEGVSIASFTVPGKEEAEGKIHSINFRRNGISDPFEIKIVDQHGNFVIVKVDALACAKATRYGKE
jgi:prepilin-type N-terminal cleavage/methylation domain-containing protein